MALAIARAYKKTYNKDIIFNRESHGRDGSIANVNGTIGWFTSQFPIIVEISNGNDNISLMRDVYAIKNNFNDVNNLGLNYLSLIYTTEELDFKQAPVTFNFLSTEFTFKNELFESVNKNLYEYDEINLDVIDHDSYGVTFNVSRVDDAYVIYGDYADGTYISEEFSAFIENIKNELEFIGKYDSFEQNIVCCLSESQLGVYLDEKAHDKGTAYSAPDFIECSGEKSVDEIKNAITTLIDTHPILKGRVLDTGELPLLVCDSYPEIEIIHSNNYSDYIKPFDLNKSLAHFVIINNDDGKFIFYDIHHIINDATTRNIINSKLNTILSGELIDDVDLGFIYASNESFEAKFKPEYKTAYKFFNKEFSDIEDVISLFSDIDGCNGGVSLPIRGIREDVVNFAHENSITVGSLLNAIFAYTYSRFICSDKVYYNFTEHGRHEDYSQDSVGMFIRTIPILMDCKYNSVSNYVRYASDLILESMKNSIYP